MQGTVVQAGSIEHVSLTGPEIREAEHSDGVAPRRHHLGLGRAFEPRPLAIAINLDHGWALVIDRPTSPVLELVGRCDERGIDAMLDLAIAVNTGAFGNVFGR
uniref:hypothetical protein n=1 Tax=Amycolatopsis sp. CA-096443 TaxID=3239919 RepID=UPI003F494F0E